MTGRLIDAIAEALLAARDAYNPAHVDAPAALLWPDRGRYWEPVVDRLRERLPIVTLGDYAPASQTGPAIWIRCVVAGEIQTADPPVIIYLPGVGRDQLRAVEGCPSALAPIAELQYRGEWFSHRNGRDWTVRTFLAHEQGLDLPVSDDKRTNDMLAIALPQLLDEPLRRLQRQAVIDWEVLQDLVTPDVRGDVLRWLDEPSGFRDERDAGRWRAFVSSCRTELDFDPDADGPIHAARLLGQHDGPWQHVWRRFREAPEQYPGVPDRLEQAKPGEQLLEQVSGSWPQDNLTAENELRRALSDLEGATASAARDTIGKLWDRHGERQRWVWAQLGRAPLVDALEHLVRVAEGTNRNLDGSSVQTIQETYAQHGWQVDAAALACLSRVRNRDRDAVASALEAVYRPWLRSGAEALQIAIGPMVHSGTYSPQKATIPEKGAVTVFIDGLRLDVAHRLLEQLQDLDTELATALAALPTVTANSKPLLAPVPEGSLVGGGQLGAVRATTGAAATQQVLTSLMAERGVTLMGGTETGDPSGPGWTEAGRLDAVGHESGVGLVDQMDNEVRAIARRIRELIDAGWGRVEVVTDHGFLLLPSGLPKAELPIATVVKRKGRCARLAEGASVDVPVVPWSWDAHVRIGLAPGISCFTANRQYEHGGVSPQECVVPRLTVGPSDEGVATGRPDITGVTWRGLICGVEFESVAGGATADIRRRPADASSSIAMDTRATRGAGKASLFAHEDVEGEEAYVVLVDADGQILAQKPVTVGQNR